jgi:hypothetical protein
MESTTPANASRNHTERSKKKTSFVGNKPAHVKKRDQIQAIYVEQTGGDVI